MSDDSRPAFMKLGNPRKHDGGQNCPASGGSGRPHLNGVLGCVKVAERRSTGRSGSLGVWTTSYSRITACVLCGWNSGRQGWRGKRGTLWASLPVSMLRTLCHEKAMPTPVWNPNSGKPEGCGWLRPISKGPFDD